MQKRIYIIILLLLVKETTEININETLFYLARDETVTYAQAKDICENVGSQWGLPDHQSFGINLTDYIRMKNVPSIWLGLKKMSFGRWMWLNNTSINNDKIVEDPGYMCGGIAVQGMRLQSMSCSESGNGFVCEMPGDKWCPEKIHTQNCIQYENTWYMIACNSKNWYHAKAYCISQGGHLALLDSVKKRFAILNVIVERSLFQQCGWLYIGLRQEDWFLQNANENGDTVPQIWKWASAQPKFGKQECTILRANGFWYSTSCEENRNVICQNYGTSKSHIKHLYYIKENNKQNKMKTWIPDRLTQELLIGLLSVTFISIVITSFVVCLVVKRCSKNHINCDTNHPDLLDSMDNGFTVVIFSSPLDDWFVRKVTSVKHIEWPFVQKYKSSTGTSMAAALYTYLDKLGIEKLTRCICIDALDSNGELPEEIAKDILKYLCNNIREFVRVKQTNKARYKGDSIIDIVLLPKFKMNSPDPVEILKSLYFLKKHVILLSNASLLPTLPSTEVISVGGATELHEPVFSVVDFLLRSKRTEWNTEESAQYLALAVVSAIAIAILNTYVEHKPRVNLQGISVTPFIRHALVAQFKQHNSQLANFELTCVQVDELFPTIQSRSASHFNLNELCLNEAFITKAVRTFTQNSVCPFPVKNLPRNATFNNEHLTKYNHVIQLNFYHEREYNIQSYKGWTVENTARTKQQSELEKKVNGQFKVLIDTLLQSNISSEILRKHVKFRQIHRIEIVKHSDTLTYQQKDENCQVVAIMSPLADDSQKEMLMPLEKLIGDCIVITPCVASKRPPLPVDFPSNLVISPGTVKQEDEDECMVSLEGIALCKKTLVKWQSCGSSLDFVCQWWSRECTLEDPWEATSFTIAIITIILLKAHILGLENSVIQQLQTTKVMQRVLRFMCSNKQEHQMFEGWGILEPWEILDNPNDLLQLIHDCTSNADQIHWNGRNI